MNIDLIANLICMNENKNRIPLVIRNAIKGINDENRQFILDSLMTDGAKSFTTLKNELQLSKSNLSHHLHVLLRYGLIYNFFKEKKTNYEYSYYEISKLGKLIIENLSSIVEVIKPNKNVFVFQIFVFKGTYGMFKVGEFINFDKEQIFYNIQSIDIPATITTSSVIHSYLEKMITKGQLKSSTFYVDETYIQDKFKLFLINFPDELLPKLKKELKLLSNYNEDIIKKTILDTFLKMKDDFKSKIELDAKKTIFL